MIEVEIEKPSMDLQAVLPMLSRCDVVFFSSDYIKAHAPTAGEADGDDWQKLLGLFRDQIRDCRVLPNPGFGSTFGACS